MHELVIKHYENIFGQITGRRDFEFNPTANQKTQINNFIELLEKNIGVESLDEDFIFLFIVFQFERKHDQKTRFGKGRVPLNHVIGKKAYERWLRKPDNWKYWVDKLIEKYDIEKPVKIFKTNNGVLAFCDYDETIKRMFKGTGELFFHCMELTTLYNPASECCEVCEDKQDCQEIQKQIYPKVHETRKR